MSTSGIADLERIARRLAARGLLPIVDRMLEVVRAECPSCHAAATDPLGLWRPLQIVPRSGRVSVSCDGCGRGGRYVR